MPPISQTTLDAIDRNRARTRRRELTIKTFAWTAALAVPATALAALAAR